MVHLWDYEEKELNKSEKGRILILERWINYGVYLKDTKKLPLDSVKKYWNKLHIDVNRRKFLKFLIWGN